MKIKQSFSTSEVAVYCHVTADTIRKWAEAGRIRVFKTPGGHRRIRREDLLDFLRTNEMPVHPDLRENGVRILVVEEDSAVSSSLARLPEADKGLLQVEIAKNMFEAGHQVATFEPDMVLLDCDVAGEHAPAICRRIRQDGNNGTPIIVAITANGHSEGIVADALQHGASAHLRKPLDEAAFRQILDRAGLGRR